MTILEYALSIYLGTIGVILLLSICDRIAGSQNIFTPLHFLFIVTWPIQLILFALRQLLRQYR